MHIIDKIEIDGFRGSDKPLVFKLNSHVNFFIGRNGTGKTSLMNLINSAINVDLGTLLISHFQSIQIRFKKPGSNSRPTLIYQKRFEEAEDEFAIYCSFQQKASDRAEVHRLYVTDIHSYRWYKASRGQYVKRPDHFNDPVSVLKEQLNQLVNKSWLSVNRALFKDMSSEQDRRFESPVDKKLHQVSSEFGSYFSQLDKMSASETDRFQTAYFLSLISPPRVDSLHQEMKGISPAKERVALQEMFSEFRLKQSSYSTKLDNFSRRMTKALDNYQESKPIPGDEFLTLTDTLRIHDLAEEWQRLQEKRRQIYEPKQDFTDAVNSLFYRKTISINAGNQLEFYNDAGEVVTVDKLSSGEKQLVILLGETLLQRRRQCIFMADEPEISLHIEWQELLVPSLRTINPNVQIIFATHSPDIVGTFTSNTFDLEKML